MALTMKQLRAAWFSWSKWRPNLFPGKASHTLSTRLLPTLAILTLILLAALLLHLVVSFLSGPPVVYLSVAGQADAPPVHILVADVQLGAAESVAVRAGLDRRLVRALHDVASQSQRRIVIHFIIDEATFVHWQAEDKHSFGATVDDADRDAPDGASSVTSAELERGWRLAIRAFHRQSALYRSTMVSVLPWLTEHLQHVVVLPYSYARILALPWPDSPLTVGDRLTLLCTDMALTDCASTPTGVYLVKTMLAAVLPQWADHVIVLDSDLRTHGDIGDMLRFLAQMRATPTAAATTAASSSWSPLSWMLASRPVHPVMALAAEQQTFYDLRHPSVMKGRLGFNGGVQLQDLVELRRTEPGSAGREYNERLLNSSLARQFTMGLLLGDQTVYTALNNSAPHLFLALPCEWNRQLCEYYYEPWRTRDVEARHCPGQWRIVHGNCAPERDTPDELDDQWRAFHKQQSEPPPPEINN